MVVKSAESPATPAMLAPAIPLLSMSHKPNLQTAIRDTKKTPRGTETEVLRTPRGSELEVIRTPRGSELLRSPRGTIRTPNGSEVTKTPRGFTDSQRQTLLLPNSCESRGNESDEDADDEDEDTFKDVRSSVEIRITNTLADTLAKTSSSADITPGGSIISSDVPIEYEVGSSSKDRSRMARKRHPKKAKEIEMKDLKASKKEEEDDGSYSPQPVRSFRDKLSLSLLPVVTMHRSHGDSEEPLLISKNQPNPPKAAKKYAIERSTTKVEARKARVAVGSLRGVVLKVHATYVFAILCIIATMMASFLVS